MASTYTNNTGIEKPGSGEQAGTWGTTTNSNFDIIDQALHGQVSLEISGSRDLATSDGATSDGANTVIILTGTPGSTFELRVDPTDQEKFYTIRNETDAACRVIYKGVTYSTSNGVEIAAGTTTAVTGDGGGLSGKFKSLTPPTDLVNDASPQLGANLDTNSHNILVDDAHFIGDENGNEQIIFQTTSSAVNQIDVTNAATSNAPQISATGDDTNVNLKLAGKGTGKLELASDLQINGTTNNWTIEVDSNDHLIFKYNGTAVFAIQDTGAVIAKDDITAFGTVA